MNLKTITIISIIFIGAFLRLIPHAPNFSPIAAIALFGGAFIDDKRLKYLVPLTALFISDLFLGFYGWGMLSVYGSFILIVALGSTLKHKVTFLKVGLNSVAGSIIFYLITNFAFLYPSTLYPHNFTGIIQSYVAAIPFFQNTLFGDFFYNALFFGGFYLMTANLKFLQKA